MPVKPADRWYRYGETYGTATIISKIDRIPHGKGCETSVRYLLLCQCGNVRVSYSRGKETFSLGCRQCGRYKCDHSHTDKDIYGIFFKEGEDND